MSSFNISPLFGGNNQNNIFSSFNYGDYSLIKSGSYKKMMKAYYNDQKPSNTEKAQNADSRTKEFTSKISADDKSLAKVGITVGDDNKLSVDEDKLAKADMKAVKSLFDGSYSYGAQTADKASAIASAASLNNGLYGSNGNYYNSYSNLFDTEI